MKQTLHNTFRNMTPEETERLFETLDPNIRTDENAMNRIEAKLERKLRKKHTFLQRAWKPAAIAAAACAAIYLVLGFTVPGVADTLYRISHPNHVTEEYFSAPPEERDSVQGIEAAVSEINAENLGSSVELLGAYSILTQYDEEYNRMVTDTPSYRERNGYPPFRAEDFAFLKEIRVTDSEVYYNGEKLYVNCFLSCPDTDRFLNGREDELEISTFWQILNHDGTEMPVMWNVSSGGASEIVNDETRRGLWYSSNYDLTEPLPDGMYEMTLLYYVYDCSIDDMAAPGNVGRIIHTVSFDATPGNHYETITAETSLSGSAPLTFVSHRENGQKTLENRTVSFDGLKLNLTFRCLPDGIYVTAETAKLPESWTKEETNAFLDPIVCALDMEIKIGDESVSGRVIFYGSDNGSGVWEYAFPIVAEDYRENKKAELRFFVCSVGSFKAELSPEKTVAVPKDTQAIDYPEVLYIHEIDRTALNGSNVTAELP